MAPKAPQGGACADRCHQKKKLFSSLFSLFCQSFRYQPIEMVIDSPYSAARECFGPMAHHFIQDIDKILYSGTRENELVRTLQITSYFFREVTVQKLKELPIS